MEPVPVVRKPSYTWLWWLLGVAVAILFLMWLFGAFETRGETTFEPATPGASLRFGVEDAAGAGIVPA